MVWTAIEQVTLSFIEHAADRRILLARRLDKLLADPDTPPSHLAALSSEVRLTDNMIHKWTATLNPRGEVAAKSVRHQDAVNRRWHPNGS
jgi:hypothetical protein